MTMKCHGCLTLVEPVDGRCPKCGSRIYERARSALFQKGVEDYLRRVAPNTPGLRKDDTQ